MHNPLQLAVQTRALVTIGGGACPLDQGIDPRVLVISGVESAKLGRRPAEAGQP